MLEKFLKDISPKGVVEYSKINERGCFVIDEKEAKSNKKDNIYFLGGTKKGLGKRSKDNDVENVSYIRIDIDISVNFGYTITEEIIKEEVKEAIEEQTANSVFASPSYIVFSGKGLHYYFCGPPIIMEASLFAEGMNRVLREWDKLVDSNYCADHACTNISRIMRLPTTVNQKNGATCSIIEHNEGNLLFSYLPALAKKEQQEADERKEKRRLEAEERMKSYGDLDNDDNIYKLIVDIPAYQISEQLLPQFKYTGDRNFLSDNRQGNKYTAFFYSEEKNIIINGGSSHYNWGEATSGWTSFELVRKQYNWTAKETFTFFRKLIGKDKK